MSSRGRNDPNSIGDRRVSSRGSNDDPNALTDKRVSSRGRRGSKEINGVSHDEIDFDFTPQIVAVSNSTPSVPTSNPAKRVLSAIIESNQSVSVSSIDAEDQPSQTIENTAETIENTAESNDADDK